MRIAVASMDGRNVAAHLCEATCFLIFQVDGDCVGAYIKRPACPDEWPDREEHAPSSPTSSRTTSQGALVASNAEASQGIEAERLTRLLPAFADCDFLVMGGVTDSESTACARMGIVALPVPGFTQARDAVTFVVTGERPGGGDCGQCISSPRLATFSRS